MEPFRIEASDAALTDLRDRLERTRYAIPASPNSWAAGMPPEYLRELVDHWLTAFDWRTQEKRLNAYPQFLAEIGDQTIHFVHLVSDREDSLPIVLSHGWPYTFAEMLPLADELVRDFDVVIPSLPGYGWSMLSPTEPVISRAMAHTVHRLMAEELGYERYLTYGEDVGAGLSDWLAATHPESVLGIHSAHPAFPPTERRDNLQPVEERFFEWLSAQWEGGKGYSVMQSTRPDTLAASVGDSPAGLAAWIVEKFREWSDCGGNLESRFSKDQLLTTVMIYWLTDSISTSFRAYYDDRLDGPLPLITVPAGVSVQQHEREYPREVAERTYTDLRFFNRLPRGGHFTASEEPALLADDIRAFVGAL